MHNDYDVPDDITLGELDQLCIDLADLKGQIDDLDNQKKALNQEFSELSERIITHLNAHRKDKYETPVGNFSITRRFSYKVPKTPEDREAFFGHLKSKGIFEDMITVNSNTLNAYAKKELDIAIEEGHKDFEIPGLGEPSLYEKITIRRKK